MKKLLWGVAIIAILVVAAAAVFLATFNADRYRPLLISKLQEAIGRPVTLERVSLGWRQGLALELKGLAIFEGPETTGEPLIQMDAARGSVRLLPLLKKHVEVSSVIFQRPRIHVARDAQGQVTLLGLAAAASPVAAARPPAPAGPPLTFAVEVVRIQDGTLHWTDATVRPPTEVRLTSVALAVRHIAPGQPMDLDLRAALASDVPNVRVTGRLTLPDARHSGSLDALQVTLERVALERLLPVARPDEAQLRGRLTLSLQGRTPTLDPAKAAQAVSGRGALTLEEPVIANLNMVRAVLEQLSVIPGLVETLEARLPTTYQAKLAARDTVLDPVTVSMQLDRGLMRFDELTLRTDACALSGSGTVGLQGAIDVRAVLRVEPGLSAAIIRSVNELQALANAHGELELPLRIDGTAPRVAVWPDLQYVASRVVVRKAVDLLGALLNKAQPQSSPPDTGTPGGSTGGILDQLLRRTREPAPSNSGSSQP